MFESTTATPSPLARCLEVAQLTLHATGVCLERLSERLTLVSIAAARESGRVQQLADCLPELPGAGPLTGLLGLDTAADALADARTAAATYRESMDLLAGTAFSEADRVKEITSELLAILPGVRPAESFDPIANGEGCFGDASCLDGMPDVPPRGEVCERCRGGMSPAAGGAIRCLACYPITRPLASDPPPAPLPPVPDPLEPIIPPIIPVPAPEPNPAPPTPAAEESVQVAANAGVLEAPTVALSVAETLGRLANDPNYHAMFAEPDPSERPAYFFQEPDTQSPPPDEDESQDDEADDENEGTEVGGGLPDGSSQDKLTLSELATEVFGETPSQTDEARARVTLTYPDARVITRRNGKKSGLRYLIVTGQGRQTVHLSDRRSSESGAWIDAAGRLPDLSSLSHS